MNKEQRKTIVACTHCGRDIEIPVLVRNNGSETMTKESIEEIFNGMSDLLVRKNRDYKGASFDLGMTGNMVHIWDKASRLRHLVESKEKPNFEGIEDTLKDLIGYAVIGLHILKANQEEPQNG